MPPKKKCGVYDDSYLKIGFTVIKFDGQEKLQCVLCCTVLAFRVLHLNQQVKKTLKKASP